MKTMLAKQPCCIQTIMYRLYRKIVIFLHILYIFVLIQKNDHLWSFFNIIYTLLFGYRKMTIYGPFFYIIYKFLFGYNTWGGGGGGGGVGVHLYYTVLYPNNLIKRFQCSHFSCEHFRWTYKCSHHSMNSTALIHSAHMMFRPITYLQLNS